MLSLTVESTIVDVILGMNSDVVCLFAVCLLVNNLALSNHSVNSAPRDGDSLRNSSTTRHTSFRLRGSYNTKISRSVEVHGCQSTLTNKKSCESRREVGKLKIVYHKSQF